MTPAEQLVGLTLTNGWKVLDYASRKPNATGGYFSHGYIVENADGRKGFLKAMDYSKAFQFPDTHVMLAAMTNAYIFEKNLCEKCAHLSRIVRAIDSGFHHVNPADPFSKVEYLIFELATGDVRAHLDMQKHLDFVFVMRTLHHIATGLAQLHRADIAHQDLKPSNILVFGRTEGSKICDLGRAWDRHVPAMHDAIPIASDSTYAPVELLYGDIPSDPHMRRFGCDLYHLGSLVVFLFARVHINAFIIDSLSVDHRPINWAGTYRDVLPFVQAAFDIAIIKFLKNVPPYLSELAEVVTQLCNPDPMRRGHPQNKGLNQFSLQRYISQFDRLAHHAQLKLS